MQLFANLFTNFNSILAKTIIYKESLNHKLEKVYFKSQILVHAYWTILRCLDLFKHSSIVSQHQHVLKNINITFSDNTSTPEMFQYSPILGCSSIWDLKYTFSPKFFKNHMSNLAQIWESSLVCLSPSNRPILISKQPYFGFNSISKSPYCLIKINCSKI